MFQIQEASLEWALKHLMKFSSSSFYPKNFEFKAIDYNWEEVRKYILNIDLEEYKPQTPLLSLALKPNKNFRVVHQLDPIDSIIYTALIYEIKTIIEEYRIPEESKIACSYRIDTTMEGSFFNNKTGYNDYKEKTEELANKYKNGYILICDITDFYNQIYTHRIENIISEAGGLGFEKHAKVIGNFILDLNTKTSRGIPVGPNPSILLAEAIMGDIDKKIRNYTDDFVRYVDDIRIFFNTEDAAIKVLQDLTKYLYTSHRLVFSDVKTKIKNVEDFMENYYINEEKEEKKEIIHKQEKLTFNKLEEILPSNNYYESSEIDDNAFNAVFDKVFDEIGETQQFKILSDTYLNLFNKEISKDKIDKGLVKHILFRAKYYRVRCLVPIIFQNFEKVASLIKEVVLYLKSVLNEDLVELYKEDIYKIIQNDYCKLAYVNTWLAYLLQQEMCSNICLKDNDIIELRDKALIARTRNDVTFIKDYKNSLDVLAPWDKRAIIYSSIILSKDEKNSWLSSRKSEKNILEKSLVKYVLSINNTKKKLKKKI